MIAPELPRTGDVGQRVIQAIADIQRQVGQLQQTAGSIPPDGVGNSQVAPGAITTTEIAAGTIVAGNIAAATITGTLIAANTITSTNIAANTITASDIFAHTITSNELAATAIDGMTVTGSTIRTSSTAGVSGAGVVINTLGIKGYDATATLKFNLDATTGLINAQGVILATAGSSLPVNTLVGLLPGSANRYSNSAFQNGAGTFDSTGWSTDATCTLSSGGTSAPPVYGALVLQATVTTATSVSAYVYANNVVSSFMRVLPGLSYTFSHYEYPVTVARNSQINAQFFDSSGTLLLSAGGTPKTTTLNTWTRISQTFTAPANAAYARGIHYFALNASNAEVFYLDCLQMEEGDRASAWAPRPDEILVNQINANNINVASLSAINANLGTITAGSLSAVSVSSATITGSTITGGTVQNAASDPKVVLDSSGFYVSDASAVKHVNIDTLNGLQIRAGTNTLNAIQFCDSVPGGTEIFGINVSRSTGSQSNAHIAAYASGPSGGSSGIYINDNTTVGPLCNVYVATHGYSPTLINADNQSSFVRAENKTAMRVDGGTTSVTFSSGTVSNSQPVNGANSYSSTAICVATANTSSLPFGIAPWTQCVYVGGNPPQFNITAWYTNTTVSGTVGIYYVILTW